MSEITQPYVNRELSWLEFNHRVMDEADDPTVPLLERLKFLAISASNLDEFFMVRVGGLKILSIEKSGHRDLTGMSPTQQLAAVSERTQRMVEDQYRCFLDDLEPRLAEAGVRRLRPDDLDTTQLRHVREHFEESVFPLVTAMAIDDEERLPLLVNQTLQLLVTLAPAPGEETPRRVVIPLGGALERIIRVPAKDSFAFVLVEEVVEHFIDRFFPEEAAPECAPFRITRNADLSLREDLAADLTAAMEGVLDARRESMCVRLEVGRNATDAARRFLISRFDVDEQDVYDVPGPLALSSFFSVADVREFDRLRYESWTPQTHPDTDPRESMFDVVARRDVLLCHPFDSFDPILRLLEEAADDPNVMAIKQVLYRTSRQSPIVAALKHAALEGKSVTVVVELKARFDEARNIEWARELERAGAQVIYGVKGLKIHSKVCLIVRREPGGIRRYVHYGTGNYNEITARFYTDVSYLTCNEDLGADATTFFSAVNGYSQIQNYRMIDMAPIGLRDRLLRLINAEVQRKRDGQDAHIMAKFNSLADPAIIDALYEASGAGVRIELNVRGICCLRPGVPGLSENITVVSIVDRFLEHSRIFAFHHGGQEVVLISSADCMPRNLDRRIELLVPVYDPAARERLIGILRCCFDDTVKGRRILEDGSYAPPAPPAGGPRRSSQEMLCELACESVAQARGARPLVFEPHRAPHSEFGNGEPAR